MENVSLEEELEQPISGETIPTDAKQQPPVRKNRGVRRSDRNRNRQRFTGDRGNSNNTRIPRARDRKRNLEAKKAKTDKRKAFARIAMHANERDAELLAEMKEIELVLEQMEPLSDDVIIPQSRKIDEIQMVVILAGSRVERNS